MIKGEKVILRQAVLDDRKKIFEWLAQSDITSNMIGPPEFEDNAVPTWDEFIVDYNPHYFDDNNPENAKSFIIEANGEPAGHISYNEIDAGTNTVELDIWLAGSKFCNKGYGTDAIQTLCKYLADNLKSCAFILAPSARNKMAVKAYEKCGFQPTKEPLQNFIPDYHDTVVMVKHVLE